MTPLLPDAEPKGFQLQQYRFTAHIRAPDSNPAPEDVEDRRMAVYRELFYNNVEGLLATGFPVIREILPDRHWHTLVRDFFARHRCKTPLFPELPGEFIRFLQEERQSSPEDPPFLAELAHYEWVELALSISDADQDPLPPHDVNGDLLTGVPLLSPLAWNLSYQYPVHRIGPDFQPRERTEALTHLVVYRDRDDDIGFLEINAVTQRLIAILKENAAQTGLDALKRIAQELSHPEPATVVEAGSRILGQLRGRNILLGTLATNPD